MYDARTSISTRMFTLAISISALRLRLFSCLRHPIPVYTYNKMTQAQENGNRSILLCLCLRCCVVHVNRDDESISTRRRRTGLHVGFLWLCLCLRRACKPGLKGRYVIPFNNVISVYITGSNHPMWLNSDIA